MPDRSPPIANAFAGLRNQLFRGDLAGLAPAAPADPSSGTELQVFGVAMEVGLDTGSYLVFGLRDGTASIYLSTGGGSIGGQGRPQIHAAAKALVETARPLVGKLPLVHEYPLPTEGRVRFSIFTSMGVRATEVAEDELKSGRSEFVPLFAPSRIITAFRLVQEKEPSDELGYVNCLLTALARGSAPSATLVDGVSLPDLASLTADDIDRQWMGFDLDRLSTMKIIRKVLRMAGFRWFQFTKTEGRIKVKLAAQGGESLSDVVFSVLKRQRAGRTEIEIAKVRSLT